MWYRLRWVLIVLIASIFAMVFWLYRSDSEVRSRSATGPPPAFTPAASTDLQGQEVDYSRRTSPLGEQRSVGSEAILDLRGWIDLVPVPGECLAAEDAWTLVSLADGSERGITSAEARGRIEVDAGRYTVSTASGSRSIYPQTFFVSLGRGTALWVGGPRRLEVHVRDGAGAALGGTALAWVHLDSHGRPLDDRRPAIGRTDLQGRGALELDGPVQRGRLDVRRDGYRPIAQELVAAPSVPLRVVLEVETVVRLAGWVQDCASGAVLAGVRVHDGEERLLATSGPDGSIDLPADARQRGSLRLSGDTIAMGWIEAPVADDFRLCAVPLVRQVLRIESAELPGEVDLVTLTLEDSAGCTVEAARRTERVGDSIVTVSLPRGVRVLAAARDSAGSAYYADFQVVDPPVPVELLASGSSERLLLEIDGAADVDCTVEPLYESRLGLSVLVDPSGTFTIPFASDVRRVVVRGPGRVPIVLGRVPGSREPRSGRVRLSLNSTARCELELRDENGAPLPGVRVRTWSEQPGAGLGAGGPSGAQPTDHPAWCVYEDTSTEFVTNVMGLATLAPIAAGVHSVALGTPSAFGVSTGADLYQQQLRTLVVPEGDSRFTWTVPRPATLLVECVAAGTGLPVRGIEARLVDGLANSVGEAQGNYWQAWVPRSATRILFSAKGYDRVELALPPQGATGGDWFARVEFHPGNDGRIVLRGVPPERFSGRTLRLVAEERVGDVWVVRWNGAVDVMSDGTIALALPLEEARLSVFDTTSPAAFVFQPARQAWVSGQVLEVRASESK